MHLAPHKADGPAPPSATLGHNPDLETQIWDGTHRPSVEYTYEHCT